MSLSQWDLAIFLKTKNRYMTARQIAIETKATLPSVFRKLNKLSRKIERKTRKMRIGKSICKRQVTFFKFKR